MQENGFSSSQAIQNELQSLLTPKIPQNPKWVAGT
jgi:hypothetical protein